jgi:hypothetical protein
VDEIGWKKDGGIKKKLKITFFGKEKKYGKSTFSNEERREGIQPFIVIWVNSIRS